MYMHKSHRSGVSLSVLRCALDLCLITAESPAGVASFGGKLKLKPICCTNHRGLLLVLSPGIRCAFRELSYCKRYFEGRI